MKKKLLRIILTISVLFCLTACDSNIIDMDSVLDSPDSKLVDFEVVNNNFYGVILVDKNTNVMYYWISGNVGGITPIYNADGTLKLYED